MACSMAKPLELRHVVYTTFGALVFDNRGKVGLGGIEGIWNSLLLFFRNLYCVYFVWSWCLYPALFDVKFEMNFPFFTFIGPWRWCLVLSYFGSVALSHFLRAL